MKIIITLAIAFTLTSCAPASAQLSKKGEIPEWSWSNGEGYVWKVKHKPTGECFIRPGDSRTSFIWVPKEVCADL